MSIGPPHAETLYRTVWDGQSCLATTASVLAIAGLVILAVLLFSAAIAWLSLRRRPEAAREWRILKVVGGALVILFAAIAYAGVSQEAIHRVAVTSDSVIVSSCAGASARLERFARRDITRFAFRQRWTGGRSRRLVDELVVTVDGRDEPLVIPLGLDRTSLDHGLLARLVPREVLMRWVAALRERGQAVPPELAS